MKSVIKKSDTDYLLKQIMGKHDFRTKMDCFREFAKETGRKEYYFVTAFSGSTKYGLRPDTYRLLSIIYLGKDPGNILND